MKKIKFEATLTYDDNIMHEKDQEAINWFYNVVLKRHLFFLAMKLVMK